MKTQVMNNRWNGIETVTVWFDDDMSTYEIIDNENGDTVTSIYDGKFLDTDGQVDYDRLYDAIADAIETYLTAMTEDEDIEVLDEVIIPDEVAFEYFDESTCEAVFGTNNNGLACTQSYLVSCAGMYTIYDCDEANGTGWQNAVGSAHYYADKNAALAAFNDSKAQLEEALLKCVSYKHDFRFFDVTVGYEVEQCINHDCIDYHSLGVFKRFSDVKKFLEESEDIADIYVHTVLLAREKSEKLSADDIEEFSEELHLCECSCHRQEVDGTMYFVNTEDTIAIAIRL